MQTGLVVCPECNSPLVLEDGEVVCQRCGLVAGRSEPESEFALRQESRRLARNDGYKARAIVELLSNQLALSKVQTVTALMLLEKVKRRAIIKRSTQDLLGAALICASRRTNARKHLTIASVVKGLRSIGYDTSIARIMRALAIFKESGLYTHPAPPMEHLEDILSNLDLSRMPPSHVAASVEIAREVLLSASLQGLLTNPRTLAACSLYSGFKQVRVRSGNGLPRISFPMLAQASGLAEFTIRDSYERCFSKVTNA